MRQNKIKNTWLAGKLKCAKCGYALVIQKTVKPSGAVFRYVICSEANQAEKRCDGVHGLKADAIEELIFEQMKIKLKQFSSLSPPRETNIDPEITQLKTRIAHLEQEIELATRKAMEASGALIKYLSDKVTSLDEERSKCVTKLNELQNVQAPKKCDVAQIRDYVSKWDELSLEDKMIVADALIDKIRLSEHEMSIKWNI